MNLEARKISKSVSVVAAEINDIADKAARLQSRSCETSSQVGGRLEKLAAETTRQADTSLVQIRSAVQLLDRNRTNISQLADSIKDSQASSSALFESVSSLDDLARNVEKAVDTIVMISLQTNMLAVSGSIEAARVGEFGRGFSVVSNDVRTLAAETGESVGRIKDIVRAIQNQIRKVSTIVEIASRRSGEAAGRASVAASGLAIVKDVANQVASGVEAISAAMSETAMAVQQANQASEQIATAAEQVSRSTSEAASAAEQASKAAAEIADAVEEIASQADDLQNS